MHVHILSRAPIAGRCKTRLIPRLGARGAAWVQRRLTERAIAHACAAVGPAQVTLWCAPDAAHAFFARCRSVYGVRLARQVPGDLGQRMRGTLRRKPGLLVGADAFGLQTQDLHEAAQALTSADFVLVPANDGGFVLIGARRPVPSLQGVAWSSGRECLQTASRLRRAGKLAILASGRDDFDTPADWQRARRSEAFQPLTRAKSLLPTPGASLSG